MLSLGRLTHVQPWSTYKSVTKAKRDRKIKWVRQQKSGIFANKLLYHQERITTNKTILKAKSDYEDIHVSSIKDNPKRFLNLSLQAI